MGLDNYPETYPCRKQGTAVMGVRKDIDGNPIIEDGKPLEAIDCELTIEAGGCPYKNELKASGLDEGLPVYGIMGTHCWYRGKFGNFLIEEMGFYDETEGLSFYGALGEHTHKPPYECTILADAIDQWLEENESLTYNGEDYTEDAKYASWYARWAAKNADGLACWY